MDVDYLSGSQKQMKKRKAIPPEVDMMKLRDHRLLRQFLLQHDWIIEIKPDCFDLYDPVGDLLLKDKPNEMLEPLIRDMKAWLSFENSFVTNSCLALVTGTRYTYQQEAISYKDLGNGIKAFNPFEPLDPNDALQQQEPAD